METEKEYKRRIRYEIGLQCVHVTTAALVWPSTLKSCFVYKHTKIFMERKNSVKILVGTLTTRLVSINLAVLPYFADISSILQQVVQCLQSNFIDLTTVKWFRSHVS